MGLKQLVTSNKQRAPPGMGTTRQAADAVIANDGCMDCRCSVEQRWPSRLVASCSAARLTLETKRLRGSAMGLRLRAISTAGCSWRRRSATCNIGWLRNSAWPQRLLDGAMVVADNCVGHSISWGATMLQIAEVKALITCCRQQPHAPEECHAGRHEMPAPARLSCGKPVAGSGGCHEHAQSAQDLVLTANV